MAKEKEPSRESSESQGHPGAVPIASVAGVSPQLQPQPQPQPQPQNEGEEAHVEPSAQRAALKETADASRKRATEAKDKADKALAEAQNLATVAADLLREAQGAEAAADPEKARYVVAEGKSLHTKSGHLGAFQEVKARDFNGGSEELEQHIKSGFVVLRR